MPPFGLFGKKKKTSLLPTLPEEEAIAGPPPPTEHSGSWRRVLSRKRAPVVAAGPGDIIARDHLYDGPIVAHPTGGSYHTNRHTRITDDLLEQHTGSSYRSKNGPYFAPTIGPADSASNVHTNYLPPGPVITSLPNQPLHGIVEEHSDNMEYRSASPVVTPIGGGRPGQPIMVGHMMPQHSGMMPQHSGMVPQHSGMMPQHTGQMPQVVMPQHTGQTGSTHMQMPVPQAYTINGQPIQVGGEYVHEHQHFYQPGAPVKLPPLDVRDANGVPQKVTEIVLDGSGIQEIPMPADGNVVFIIEDGVTLDVKDPETGEYIPLEQYYANRARFQQPVRQDQYVVVSGDASNIIVEDHEGHVLHRGSHIGEGTGTVGSPASTHTSLSVR